MEDLTSEEKLQLRMKQWELAMKGDTKMLIWLGKQYLGQKDTPTITMDNPIKDVVFIDDSGDIVL